MLNLFFLSKQSYFIIFILFVSSFFLFEEMPSLYKVYEAGRFVIIFAGLIPTMNLVKSAALQLDPIKETQKLLSSLSGENSKTDPLRHFESTTNWLSRSDKDETSSVKVNLGSDLYFLSCSFSLLNKRFF